MCKSTLDFVREELHEDSVRDYVMRKVTGICDAVLIKKYKEKVNDPTNQIISGEDPSYFNGDNFWISLMILSKSDSYD